MSISNLFKDPDLSDVHVERVARAFHEAYEELAPRSGWKTQKSSRKPWEDVPEANRRLMLQTVERLMRLGVIR